MYPFSTLATQTFSKVLENFINSLLPSNLPLCASPLVHAKIEAIGFVDVCLPF
ncbi:MAG: hypothetical protein RJA54_541 [Pseudomonadota bacterium]